MSGLRGYWVRDILPSDDVTTPRCDSVYTLKSATGTFARGKVLSCDRPAGRHQLHQSIAGIQWEHGDPVAHA